MAYRLRKRMFPGFRARPAGSAARSMAPGQLRAGFTPCSRAGFAWFEKSPRDQRLNPNTPHSRQITPVEAMRILTEGGAE